MNPIGPLNLASNNWAAKIGFNLPKWPFSEPILGINELILKLYNRVLTMPAVIAH